MQTYSRSTDLRALNALALTPTRSGKSLLKNTMFSLCLLPLAGGVAQAQVTLLNENFNSYANTETPTGWYNVGAGTPSALDGQLRWSFIRPAAVTSFQSLTLANAGDYIQASFDVRYTTAPTSSAVTTGPSLALYDSGGNPVSASTTSGSVAGHVGYKAYKAFGVTGTVPNDFVLFRDNALSRDRYGNTVLEQQASGTTIALNTTYSVSLNIERQANSDLLITYSFGALSESYTVSSVSGIYTFDTIGINLFAGDFPGVGFLDNVLVTTNAIPEPSAYALLVGGFASLVVIGRRRPRK